MKLYDLPAIWSNIENDLAAGGGEVTPEIEARIKSLLEGGADKLEAAMKVVRNLEAQVDAAESESARLHDRAKSFQGNVDRLKALMLPALLAIGGKAKTPLFTFFTVTRHPVAFEFKPGVEPWEIPSRFLRVPPAELNKAELKKAEAAGETIPGGIAVVKSTTTSLQVR